ncbi:MAG: S9 family peptidase [Acidobacteriota bacterium]
MRAISSCLFVLVLGSAHATAGDKPFTAADLWAIQLVGDPVVSPDGKQVLYSVSPYDATDNKRNGDLWTIPVAGGAARRLTTTKGSESGAVYSPDGTRIAFCAKRGSDDQSQLWVMPLTGGEAIKLTDMPLGASQPKWFPDGQRIAFVSTVIAGAETPQALKQKLEERKNSTTSALVSENRLFRFWDHWLVNDEYPHLFVVDLRTKQVTDLLAGSTRYFGLQDGTASFDISPDGSTLVFEANNTEPPYLTLNVDLFEVATSGGPVRCLTPDNPGEDGGPVFSHDGKSIAFGRTLKADGWPDRTRLALFDRASGAVTLLTESFDTSPSRWAFTPDGRALVFTAEREARVNLYTLPITGGTPREIYRGGTVTGFDLSSSGDLVFGWNTLTRPTELGVVKLAGGTARQLTAVNDALMSQFALATPREYTFAGAGEEPVQMFVMEPPGFDHRRKYPLVHLIHGGPVGTFGDNWHQRWNAQLFAAPGYLVAMVNFHGSSSFGQPFLESILGAPADKPFEDVMRATDFLIAKGSVDPQRMAAGGGSYGGYLTDWIAGHTDRFRTLFTHAGPYNLTGQFASDSTWGRHHSYGGYPFDGLVNIERQSPSRFAVNFKTPMLITHGERDYRVPYSQSLELHGTLTAKGVSSRLVVYPDENHWVLKGANAQHWYGEVLGWLERWL